MLKITLLNADSGLELTRTVYEDPHYSRFDHTASSLLKLLTANNLHDELERIRELDYEIERERARSLRSENQFYDTRAQLVDLQYQYEKATSSRIPLKDADEIIAALIMTRRFLTLRNLLRDKRIGKISVIKAYRELTNCGLKEAKDFVEYSYEDTDGPAPPLDLHEQLDKLGLFLVLPRNPNTVIIEEGATFGDGAPQPQDHDLDTAGDRSCGGPCCEPTREEV